MKRKFNIELIYTEFRKITFSPKRKKTCSQYVRKGNGVIRTRDKERMFRRRQKGDLSNTSTGKLNSRAGDVQGLTSKYEEWLTLERRRKKEDGREEKGKDGEKESEKTLQEREIRKFSRRGKT